MSTKDVNIVKVYVASTYICGLFPSPEKLPRSWEKFMRYVCIQVDDSIEMHASCWFLAPDHARAQAFLQFYGVCCIQANTSAAFLYINGQFAMRTQLPIFFHKFTWSTLFVEILFSKDFHVRENDWWIRNCLIKTDNVCIIINSKLFNRWCRILNLIKESEF